MNQELEKHRHRDINDQLAQKSPSLETQITQLWMLLDVSRVLNSTLDLDVLLRIIVEVATVVTESEAASILLVNETTGKLHFETATGAKRTDLQSIEVPLEGSIAGWIVSHNEPMVVNDVQQDPRHYNATDDSTDFQTRSLLGVPLQVKGKTIGALEVINKIGQRLYSKHDLDILQTLGAQAAVAIENARLYKDLHSQMATLKETQTRLVQSEKLAAVGELVAGVAHELNNPLTSVIGFAQLLQLNDLSQSAQEDLGKVVTQAQRAAGIVRGLLDFSRQHPPERTQVYIKEVIDSTINLLAYELRTHNIEYTINIDPDLPLTMADPHQLQQAFINLIHNARQAMSVDGGGRLTISAQLKPPTTIRTAGNNGSGPDQEPIIRIAIQDDGPGIKPDHLTRIFDPFYTTKQPGEGTGLGLSVCHGIISEHDGQIWAESGADQGCTFFVELPIVKPKVSNWAAEVDLSELPKAEAAVPISDHPAKILIIDDEIALLELLTRALEQAGFQTDMATGGQAALRQLSQTNYDLIVCDVRMHGMSGLELFQEAQLQNPDLAKNLIFITGDTVSPATRRLLDETGAPYLAKPFKPAELVEQARSMLQPA